MTPPALLPLAALAVGITLGAALARRRAPDLPFTAEDCVAAADRAMSEARWGLAIEWLERARKLAPTSARVCLDLAFAHHQAGDMDAALLLCREARRLGASDGETDLLDAIAAGRAALR